MAQTFDDYQEASPILGLNVFTQKFLAMTSKYKIWTMTLLH